MPATIHLGYEVGTGQPVRIPADRHIGITGQTQRSGKTTTIEAIISRSSGCALAFITKRGEGSFKMPTVQIDPYFRDPIGKPDPEIAAWQFVQALLEAKMRRPLFMHTEFIMRACEAWPGNKKAEGWKRPTTLREVCENAKVAQRASKNSFVEGMYYQLAQIMKIALPEIEAIQKRREKGLIERTKNFFSPKDDPLTIKLGDLSLAPGLNVMDIHKFSKDTQELIIASSMREIYKHGKNIKTVLPEAQRFWPQTMQQRTTPVAQVGELIVREGAGLGNLVYLDSQDMAGVSKTMLRAVGVWLFGVQGERNEVKRTLEMIPDPGEGAMPTRSDLMTLGKGEFFVRWDGRLIKTYVQPAWLEEVHAQAVARGELDVDTVRQVERDKFTIRKSLSDATDDPVSDSESLQAPIPAGAEGGPAAAAPGAHGSAPPEDDPIDWKARFTFIAEKYNALAEECENLKRRVLELEAAQAHPVSATESEHGVRLPPVTVLQPAQQQGAIPPGENKSFENVLSFSGIAPAALPSNGAGIRVKTKADPEWRDVDPATLVDALWQPFRQKALAESPIILHLMAQRPELQVEVQRTTVKADGDSVMGRVALLIHEGWFAAPRPGTVVQKEMGRRGCEQPTTNIYRACDRLTEMGFLTKETEGYLETSNAKTRIEA